MHDHVPPDGAATRGASFCTTRWSLVLSAQHPAEGAAAQSLETLCRQYWRPLYAYVRQRGSSPHDAQDLTQEFFARLLEKDWLKAAARDKGRFRSFLLMALKRFLANEWDRARAAKRHPTQPFLYLDADEAESHFTLLQSSTSPAESLFDRRWAMILLETVMRRLHEEYEGAGKLDEYGALKPCLTAERGDIDYNSLASALRIEPASARSSVHRLRKRFRELFREEIAATVADPADVEDEMRAVIAALAHE